MLPIILFVTVWIGVPWLVLGCWAHPLLPGGWSSVLGSLALFALPVWTLVLGVRGKLYPTAAIRLLILRPFWYAMLVVPVVAAASLPGAVVGLPFGQSSDFALGAAGIACALVAVMAVVGYFGSRRLVVRHLEVDLPRLPGAFDGLRVVQISDLHVGPHTARRFLQRVAERVQREEPDLIVITGDQVDDFARDVDYFNDAFGSLQAPLGVMAIAGNHDIYAGWEAVQHGLSAAGFTVLVNRATALEREGKRLWVAGTGDPAAQSSLGAGSASAAPDIALTLAGIPRDEPVLALAHNPALWPALAERGVDLTLSGHTHYGQLALPSRNWCMASPFLELAMGAHRLGHALLYINPGTNFWGLPFRIGTPPEVTVLTLRASASGSSQIRAFATATG